MLKLTTDPLDADSDFPLYNMFMGIGLASPLWKDELEKFASKSHTSSSSFPCCKEREKGQGAMI